MILAIIAVITVPIILNIIENSKKGAAQDSAYGYKDAVNKAYVTELSKPNKENLKLQGEYSVSNGVLNGTGFSNVEIPLSGTKPSSGKLHYTNNILDDGCLVIGDYKVTFKSDGSINETLKGNCDDYVVSGGSEQGSNQQTTNSYSMAEMCPGCFFGLFYNGDQYVDEELLETYKIGSEDPIYEIRDDYSDLGNYFSGIVMDEDIVDRIFVCGIESGNTFCLEGDSEKVDNNLAIIRHFFPSCNLNQEVESDGGFDCIGNDVDVRIYPNNPGTYNIRDDDSVCWVDGAYRAYCGN